MKIFKWDLVKTITLNAWAETSSLFLYKEKKTAEAGEVDERWTSFGALPGHNLPLTVTQLMTRDKSGCMEV